MFFFTDVQLTPVKTENQVSTCQSRMTILQAQVLSLSRSRGFFEVNHCFSVKSRDQTRVHSLTRGPFPKRPGKLTGPVSYFEIKVSRKLGCVLASNKVHFVSLAENFTV